MSLETFETGKSWGPCLLNRNNTLMVTLSKTTCYSITSRSVSLLDNYYQGAYCKLLVPPCDLCSSYKQKSQAEATMRHSLPENILRTLCPFLEHILSYEQISPTMLRSLFFGPTLSLGTGLTLSKDEARRLPATCPSFTSLKLKS